MPHPSTLRQGDVLLIAHATLPDGVVPVQAADRRLVLALGEATGHAHAVLDARADLVSAQDAEELWLIVHGDAPVELVHEEHDTVEVPPGVWEVRRQREYAPEAVDRSVLVGD